MSIYSDWLVENRVIHCRIVGKTTLAEIAVADREVRAMLDAGDPLVHVLVDRREAVFVPRSARSLREALQALDHRNLGWTLLISPPHPAVDLLATVVTASARARYRRFTSSEAALDFPARQDASLPAISTPAPV